MSLAIIFSQEAAGSALVSPIGGFPSISGCDETGHEAPGSDYSLQAKAGANETITVEY